MVKPRSECVHDSVCMTAQCHTLCCDTLIIMISWLNAPPICEETIQAMHAQFVRLVLCESIILYVGIYIYTYIHTPCIAVVNISSFYVNHVIKASVNQFFIMITWFLNTILLLVQLIHFCSRLASPGLSLSEYEARTSQEVPTGIGRISWSANMQQTQMGIYRNLLKIVFV